MKARILIVEDEMIVAQDMRMTLEKLGYEVVGAVDTGAKALYSVEYDKPNLVLMDVRIKGDLDGVETAGRIHDRLNIPIIFLTAYADDGTLGRVKQTEPFGYLVKPVQELDLHTTIEISLHKYEMESKELEQKEWFRTTLRSIGDAVITTDAKGCVTFMNPAAASMLEWNEADACGHRIEIVAPVTDEYGEHVMSGLIDAILKEGRTVNITDDYVLTSRNGRKISVTDSGAPIVSPGGEVLGAVFVFQDVTEKHRREQEREMLIASLQEARTEVKSLRELIPICSVCKKVRDDTGYWKEVEQYISEQTDASFSHGICPDCLKKLYPEYSDELSDIES